MDRWGRRSSTISGGLVMALCMVILGSIYAIGAGSDKVGKWIAVGMIYVFIAA